MIKIKKLLMIIKRKFDILLIVVGIVIISIAVGMKVYSTYEKDRLIQDYEKYTNITDDALNTSSNNYTTENKENADDKSQENNLSNIIDVISIPKIDLKAPIGQGVDNETLKYSVGHFSQTCMPGDKGNCCIIGHRSYTYGEFFNRLDELDIGDNIILQNKNTNYAYNVTKVFTVKPEDTYVLDDSNDYEITLITCTPLRVGTHRLIIKGTLQQ